DFAYGCRGTASSCANKSRRPSGCAQAKIPLRMRSRRTEKVRRRRRWHAETTLRRGYAGGRCGDPPPPRAFPVGLKWVAGEGPGHDIEGVSLPTKIGIGSVRQQRKGPYRPARRDIFQQLLSHVPVEAADARQHGNVLTALVGIGDRHGVDAGTGLELPQRL